jgi:hypothetical protein
MAKTQITTDRIKDFTEGGGTGYSSVFYPANNPFGESPVRNILIKDNLAVIVRSTGGTRIAISEDGANFRFPQTANNNSSMYGVVEVDGVWIVTGATVSQRSTDKGRTWENITLPTQRDLRYSATGHGVVVVAVQDGTGDRVYRSTDKGVTWVLGTTQEDNTYSGCFFAYGNFYICSSLGTNRVQRSTDLGLNFLNVTTPTGNWNHGIGYNGLVVLGSNGGSGNKIAKSVDNGVTFTTVTNGFNLVNHKCFADIDGYLYSGLNDGMILRTKDVVTWELVAELGQSIEAISGGIINGVPTIVAVTSTGTSGNRVFSTTNSLL